MARSIAKNLNGYKVIVTKSTVPVGTGEKIKKIILEKNKKQADFDIVSNPEFLREGSAIEDFMRPNRVVIGASSERAVEVMKELYRPLYLIETPFVITNVESAEMIKYASNAFLATKISLDEARKIFNNIEYCKDSYQAAEGSDALVLITEWNQFRNLDLVKLKESLRLPIIIDLRNIYEPQRMKEMGFKYTSVGRG